ncbi:oligosaccharide flippase family protein [Alistipes sp.]|uniref:oligosaccharide flippase family protein n=1 Tax=Alistipes sp. TaxID=1872444 RepID=UPI003AF0ACE8
MEESNKRIAKNTAYLYIRMLASMLVSLYTTRVVLQALGVSDYGIYNVVGGFVAMFGFFNSVLQSGTRRFITLHLGKGDLKLLRETFTTSMYTHTVISIVVLILAETIGLWFLNYKLVIPVDRLAAANIVYQFSIASTVLTIMQTPYIAVVTAHEKFDIYAYMSIFDVVMKLVIVFLLIYLPGDKLVLYAALTMGINLAGILIYRIYCHRKYSECVFSLKRNKGVFRSMLHFSAWTALGHLSSILSNHGQNIVLNLFFGTLLNAARGLSDTITWLVKQFIFSFMTAANPQLVKFHGAGNREGFTNLIFNISQYTLFLFSVIAIPVFLEIDFVLRIWLETVPQYTALFIKAVLLISLISFSNNMIDQGIVAIGRVKESCIYVTPIYLTVLPLSYLLFRLGLHPASCYAATALASLLGFFANLYLLSKHNAFPAMKYLRNIFLKNTLLSLVAFIPPFVVQRFMEESWLRLFIVCGLSLLSTIAIMYNFSLSQSAKTLVKNKLKSILAR